MLWVGLQEQGRHHKSFLHLRSDKRSQGLHCKFTKSGKKVVTVPWRVASALEKVFHREELEGCPGYGWRCYEVVGAEGCFAL